VHHKFVLCAVNWTELRKMCKAHNLVLLPDVSLVLSLVFFTFTYVSRIFYCLHLIINNYVNQS